MPRRQLILGVGGTGCAVLAGLGAALATAASRDTPRRVAITARKFTFGQAEIHAHVGESIVLEITSVDFVHGFALPELNVRVDAPPGRTVTLPLPALPAGRYTYLCDNFCGEAHDKMTGTLVVA